MRKIAYFSTLPFTDCDFPLIREMQRNGLGVRYYITVDCYALKGALINIKTQYPKCGVFPASIYEEFNEYSNYLDLSNVFVVNRTHKSAFHISTIILYFKLLFHILKFSPDIFHITQPLSKIQYLLFVFKNILITTVHDPIPHSGKDSVEINLNRKHTFRNSQKLILLNDTTTEQFCNLYRLSPKKIYYSHLGAYDCIEYVTPKEIDDIPSKYILFFGLIAPYKGLEYLLQAFDKVHETHPEVHLVVAGGGRLYPDDELYKNKEFITIQNRYISVQELSWLLSHCLFSVLPYKDATQSGVVQTAFSMGTPLIVTNVGSLPVAVTNNENGLVIPPFNVNSLVTSINHLLDTPDELQRMKNNINQKWRSNMEWNTILEDYINCYNN